MFHFSLAIASIAVTQVIPRSSDDATAPWPHGPMSSQGQRDWRLRAPGLLRSARLCAEEQEDRRDPMNMRMIGGYHGVSRFLETFNIWGFRWRGMVVSCWFHLLSVCRNRKRFAYTEGLKNHIWWKSQIPSQPWFSSCKVIMSTGQTLGMILLVETTHLSFSVKPGLINPRLFIWGALPFH